MPKESSPDALPEDDPFAHFYPEEDPFAFFHAVPEDEQRFRERFTAGPDEAMAEAERDGYYLRIRRSASPKLARSSRKPRRIRTMTIDGAYTGLGCSISGKASPRLTARCFWRCMAPRW